MDVYNKIVFVSDFCECEPKVNDAPARLKLRGKTLSGLHQNMARIDAADDLFSIPTASLAKKKKKLKKEEPKMEVPVLEEKEVVPPVLEMNEEKTELPMNEVNEPVVNTLEKKDDTMINAIDLGSDVFETNGFKRLNASPEKFEAMEFNANKIMRFIIPEGALKLEEPVKEESTITFEIPSVQVDDFNAVPGLVGEISSVEEVKEDPIIPEKEVVRPNLDEVREKILPVQNNVVQEETALDKAKAEEIFAETSKLKDELQVLQAKDREMYSSLDEARKEYDTVVNTNNELERTLAAKKQEKQEKMKMFYQVAGKQKSIMSDYKETLIARQESYKKELEEVNSKTLEIKDNNSKSQEEIDKENSEISKYDSLIEAVSNFEIPEESYERRLVA